MIPAIEYPEAHIFSSSQGAPTARLGTMSLHSGIDPIKEASRLASSPETQTADLVVVFGGGLGYVIDALLNLAPDRKVILVEPDPHWPELVAGQLPGTALLHPSVTRINVSHKDDLILLFQDVSCRNPALIANPTVRKLAPDLYDLCLLAITEFKARFQVNVNTLQRFAKLWVRNLARNLEYINRAPGIAFLEGVYADLPGLLVAGGPSLDTYLSSLPALRERCVVVAVDTSLRACLRAGVDPDFVVMADPQYWNTRHLDNCSSSKAVVISESSVYPPALRILPGPVLLCSSLFPLGQYFESFMPPKGKLGAGGSVATTAWDFLRFIGCTKIYTLGLDLSFPGGNTHFHGSIFEETSHKSASRLTTAETMRYLALYGAGTYPTHCDEGSVVLSDKRMDMYVHWFENQCRQHPEVSNYRIGKGFRRIQGFEPIALEAALQDTEASARDRCRALRSVIDHNAISALQEHTDTLEKPRKELIQELESLRTIAHDGKNISNLLMGAPDDSSANRSLFLRLDELDYQLIGSKKQRIVGFLIEEHIQTISTGGKPKDMEEALKRSRDLYSAVESSCEYLLALFNSRN